MATPTRVNQIITVAAGTPVQVASKPTYAREIFIQMGIGSGTATGYVMAGIPDGTTPSKTTSAHLTAQLSPATATAPGGSYSDSTTSPGGFDVSQIWVDGDHTGDKIIVSYDTQLGHY